MARQKRWNGTSWEDVSATDADASYDEYITRDGNGRIQKLELKLGAITGYAETITRDGNGRIIGAVETRLNDNTITSAVNRSAGKITSITKTMS